jgi:hypothetical protein
MCMCCAFGQFAWLPHACEQEAAKEKLNELKAAIWGVTAKTRCYATGEWTAEASDIMRREHDYMRKYFEHRDVTEKVCAPARTCTRQPQHAPRAPC